MSLGTLSYLAAAAAFALLALLLFISWGGRAQGARFILAAVLSLVWALVLAGQAWLGHMPFLGVYAVELLRGAAWLAVLLIIGQGAVPRLLRWVTYGLWAVLALGGVGLAINGDMWGPRLPSLLLSSGGLGMALCGLVLLEQIFRNANEQGRRALKPLLFAIGGIFAYDLFLYSQAELFGAIGADAWNLRGIVNAMLVPLIAVAVRRNPQWSLDIFVSRHVLFYTSSFMLVGGYLLLMALGGYYLRAVGGSWGGLAQIAFFVGALAVLVTLIFSENLRARTRVFLSKHFYRNKYDYRVEWLRFIRTLSSNEEPGEDAGRVAVRAIAQIFGSPGGVLYTVDETGRRFVTRAAWPMRLTELPQLEALRAGDELPAFLAERQWIVDLEEYALMPDLYRHIELPAWVQNTPGLRLISPLLQLDRLVGFVLLYAPQGSFKLTYEDRDLLLTAGRQVAIQIAQADADRKLTESRQFAAYNRLAAFMMHDLKNSAAQLHLLVKNAERHRNNPEFIDDAIGTIANTAERITRLTEQLASQKTGAVQGGARGDAIDLAELTRGAVERTAARKPPPNFVSTVDAVSVQADAERLGSVIEHVIRNAQDATPEDGAVNLSLTVAEGEAHLSIVDTGSGMEAQFLRERLFRPFDSTKGSKGMGIGAYQAREYVRQLGGDVEVQSSPGRGTVFSITLPLAPAG